MLLSWASSLVCVGGANAETIQAASCSRGDVQKAIDAAHDGDTVEVPAGTATWAAQGGNRPAVLISGKVLTLKGAGVDRTVITDGNTAEWKDLLLWIDGGKPARITGFTFKGGARGAAAIAVRHSTGWRIDHCKFQSNHESRGIWSYADSFGVIDNCSFVGSRQGVCIKGNGAESWKKALALGTAEAVYIEDCNFADVPLGAVDAYHGARYVFRHNTIMRPGKSYNAFLGHHGCDSGGYRSTFSFEIYANKMQAAPPRGQGAGEVAHLRGGTGVIFNNAASGCARGINATNYRSSKKLGSTLCKSWGVCDGTNPNDGNEEPNGYPALDQIGRSTHQILEPLYEWDNTLNGKDMDIGVSTGPQHIQKSRDFYNDTKRPGYKPYTYPHPLREQFPPLPPADKAPPTTPGNLTARATSQRRVELTWEPSTDDKTVAGYFVWLRGSKVTTITDPSYTNYVFLRLKPAVEDYTFSVSAFDAAGNESQPCAPVKAARY